MAQSKEHKELLKQARERLKDCVDDESIERSKMRDDLDFCTLDQWDAQIRRERENDPNGPRPCLTIDKINQYIVQVVNDMRQNRPAVKIRPVDDASDPETAKIYAGLVRHIEDVSDASISYETAGESSVKIGLGYFRIGTRYVGDDSGDQEIYVGRIPDTFSVYLGPHIMPDGSDCDYGFVIEEMSVEDFERKYPGKKTSQEDFADLGADMVSWRKEESITVCEYFYAEYSTEQTDEYEKRTKRIKWCKLTGVEILMERDWPGRYVPIVEVVGREATVRGRRVLWGLVRPAKDSLRMNNYWMSAITEKIGLAPKIPFIGAKGQFEGVENAWKNANRENRAYLEYNAIDVNGNAIAPPARVAPAPLEVAMVNMTSLIERAEKPALGMQKAAVGDTDSQQSGRAILALQKESDTGTFHFSDNLSRSIKHAGRIMVDLIPKVYDTRRVVRILGEDGAPASATIDPTMQAAHTQVPMPGGALKSIYNLGVGHYDVTVTVGPSYTTARQEAATVLTELANSAKDPVSGAVMRYLAVKNSDFHGSDEMTRMLKALLPPALQQEPSDGQPQIPPQVAAQMQQMQQALQAMGQELQELQSGERQAQAKIKASHDEAMAKQSLAEREAEFNANQEREAAKRESELAVYKADLDARTKIQVAQIQANCKLSEANIASETDQNISFMQGENEKEMAATQAPEGETAAQPKAGLREVMMGLAQLVAQMAQTNQQMMAQQQQQHADMMNAMMRPKTVSARMPSGTMMNATVQ